MMWFVVVTSLYFILKYVTSTKKGMSPDEKTKNQRIWAAAYMLFLMSGQFFLNLKMTYALCGSNQWGTTFYMTFLPWVLIFGVINIILMIFPGWLSPFANTIGYGVTRLAGLSDLMGKIFRFKRKGEVSQENEQTAELLGKIYADKSLLINEITPDTIDDFWKNMWPLFRESAQTGGPEGTDNPLKERLGNLVILKELVATFCWYILSGMLVTGVSYNYVMGAGCSRTAAEIKKRHEKFLREEAEVRKKKASEGHPRVYTNTGK
jgi:hypothetical protein